ncbi:hypothetical protein BDV96DRAFT_498762 [Lophiotrema nucula]|uniref:Zn(2)-C6 fungal-type domain-containing protein n=1 Tax=Lophiotrema nucula TaxID=690887 RepID=A0A6A5YY64_9PLEO|nr:hypothetical protein BDV96DRAFT_498762 [Lophiotrema nucula]
MSSAGVEKRGSSATVRACDSCRRRKRKCVWLPGAEGCTPCLQVKEECSTTHTRKPRAKSHKRNRIAEYESRIQRLESLLEERTAAQPPVREQQPLPPADASHPLSEWTTNLRDTINEWPIEEGPQLGPPAFADGFEGFDNEGFDNEALGLNASSSSEESPLQEYFDHPLPDLSLSLGDEAFGDLQTGNDAIPAQVSPVDQLIQVPTAGAAGTDVSPFITRATCDGYLPHPDLATSLLSEFLVDFNQAIPLYRPHVIAQHLRTCYLGLADGSALAWANTYAIFGIAHRLRAMSAAATPQDNEQADYYLKKILSSVPNLLLTSPSLPLIQCLLALAVLIQTTSHASPYSLFVSTALRMAQCLVYNDDKGEDATGSRDVEQERRVFWIAFHMDTDVAILSHGLLTHRRDDINCAICPKENTEDDAGAVKAAEGGWRVNIFALRTRLSLFEATTVDELFSIKARDSTPEMSVKTAQKILNGLKEWRKHELFQFKPQDLMQLLYRSDLVHIAALEAAYFATVFRIQAFLALGMDNRVHPFSIEGLTAIAGLKNQPCYEDARRFLSLLTVAPQGDIGLSWYIPVLAALITVLSYAYNNPNTSDAPSHTDMRSYSDILQVLATLCLRSQDAELGKARALCMALFSKVEIAKRVREIQSGQRFDVRVGLVPAAEAAMF